MFLFSTFTLAVVMALLRVKRSVTRSLKVLLTFLLSTSAG
jgi:hypothetical protein